MMVLQPITHQDRVLFEGREVLKIDPIRAQRGQTIVAYQLCIADGDNGVEVRKFTCDEVKVFISSEILLVDRGYFSAERQRDREIRSTGELLGATPRVAAGVFRKVFLMNEMDRLRKLGMKYTRESVEEFSEELSGAFSKYQATVEFGVAKLTTQHAVRALPASSTLLDWHRIWRKWDRNLNCFVKTRKANRPNTLERAIDDQKIQGIITTWECTPSMSKTTAARKIQGFVNATNEIRRRSGRKDLMPERTLRTYEQWVTDRSDPFVATMHREGRAKAIERFGTKEGGLNITQIGRRVEFDAWMLHTMTLDVSREQWLAMDVEERKKVPRIRLWAIVAIDVATRCVVGFSLCHTPNQEAALEALRMCFLDKTYLLRASGIQDQTATWNYTARIVETVVDSGSEFGRNPFGGHRFVQAHRTLGITLTTTPTATPSAKAYVESLFNVFEVSFASQLPGATGSDVQSRGDRDPAVEACLTLDDIQEAFIAYIAEYHVTPHSGLDGLCPATAWENGTRSEEYEDVTFSEARIREACGQTTKARITREGIRYKNNTYINEIVRTERRKSRAEKFSGQNNEVEIVVDPYNLGVISVITDEGLVAVPCTNKSMHGKSLRTLNRERAQQRIEASEDAAKYMEARDKAHRVWTGIRDRALQVIDVGVFGYSAGEIKMEVRALSFGKGEHEAPVIGSAEDKDPLSNGIGMLESIHVDDSLEDDATPTIAGSSGPLSRFLRDASDEDGSL